MTKISFIKNNQDIPFHQFLRNEKENRGCTWKRLDKICGVNGLQTYTNANTKGAPNRPPHDKFLKIIYSLGYIENDFKYDAGLSRRHSWERHAKIDYQDNLRILGDGILSITEDSTKPQKLSSNIIKEFCGDSFYQKYAKRYSDRQNLHQQLITLDPKFSVIELQHQEQHRTGIRNLKEFEKDIIETSLLDYIEQTGPRLSERLPYKTYQYVRDKLNKELKKRGLPPRTHYSVVWHTDRIWRDRH